MAADARSPAPWLPDFPPLDRDLPFAPDPVIEAYKRHVDRTLIRENLRRSPAERLRRLQEWLAALPDKREAGPRV